MNFYILGGIILVGFAAMLAAIVVLFRKTSSKPNQNDELIDVLEEVQSLRMASRKSELDAEQYVGDKETDEEPNFGEPQENLSVSMVAPFLDYAEADMIVHNQSADEIASKPAFSFENVEEPNLSVSNMETLIGTVSTHSEEK